MNAEQFKTLAGAKISKMTVEELKTAATEANKHFGLGADVLLESILDLLMERMSEKDFVDFCKTL